jgi:hypothetical protein
MLDVSFPGALFQRANADSLFSYLATEIENAFPRPKSSLAVTVTGDRAYLYFVNQNNQLQRIIKDGKTNKWGSPTVRDAPLVADAAQITAVSFGEFNHVFYAAKGEEQGFQHFYDEQ